MKKIINSILLIVLYIVSIVFLVNVFKLNTFSNLYFCIICLGVLLLLGINTFKLLRDSTGRISRIIFSIGSIILIILFVIGNIFIDSTISFVKNVTNNSKDENGEYSVLVLDSSKYTKIKQLDGLKIGFMNIDTNMDDSISSLKKEAKIDFESNNYDDISSVYDSLLNNEVSAVVVESSYLDILDENDYEHINDIRVIYSYNVTIEKNKTPNVDTSKAFIVYISGSDSRNGLKVRGRSDVNMVAVVNPNTHKILLVSIPRDYYVKLHGTSGNRDKLTHAGIYGIDMSINTIEDLLDINIDKYVKVSFGTVINVVDVIDGIDIYSDKSFTAWTNRSCSYTVGVQHVDGKCALAFARERKTYTSGDRHRGENQEQVISKIIDKMNNPKYLVKYKEILDSIDGSFATDMSYDEITSFVKIQLNSLSSWEVDSYNLDGYDSSGYTYSMPGWYLYVMEPNMNSVNEAKNRINEYLKG